MDPDSFKTFSALCESLSRVSSRKTLAEMTADYLRGLSPEQAGTAALFLIGSPLGKSRKLSVGGSILWHAVSEVAPASGDEYREATKDAVDVGEAVHEVITKFGRTESHGLSLQEVSAYFQRIETAGGRGSVGRKQALLEDLFSRMDAQEAKWTAKMISGEMRHGVSEGLMLDAVSLLAGAARRKIETAFMFAGAIDEVVEGVLQSGNAYLEEAAPRLFVPIRPMLAEACESVEEALSEMGGSCLMEYKLDGARIQVHKHGSKVSLFSRSLRDLTPNLPEIEDMCRALLEIDAGIFDGEVIAAGSDGSPRPFQELSKRITAKALPLGFAEAVRVQLYLFDVLSLEGKPVYDLPFEKRRRLLASTAPDTVRVPALKNPSVSAARGFFEASLGEGHEGLIAKNLSSPYRPGSRGKHWLKIKKKTTLDLVIVGAEYGYGRRHGWLSNYLLAARDETTGKLLPVGKTFKGLTDAEFEEMTMKLKSVMLEEQGWSITVRPEIVVEVSFGDIQKSRRYESGYALRFARIERIRDDRNPNDIDTLQQIERIYAQEALRKGRR